MEEEVAFALGIDEAGRGPVIGPMVYACAWVPVDRQEFFRKQGYNDSKQVKPEARAQLFKRLVGEPDCGFRSRIISAEEISNASFRRHQEYDLNQISHDTAIQLVRSVVDDGVNVRELYVDTVGPEDKYQAKLQKLFPGINVTVKSKADSLFPVVSVASIVAKVIRDGVTESLHFEESATGLTTLDRNYGNGYPGAAPTKEWLQRHFEATFGFPRRSADPRPPCNGIYCWQHCRFAASGRPIKKTEKKSTCALKTPIAKDKKRITPTFVSALPAAKKRITPTFVGPIAVATDMPAIAKSGDCALLRRVAKKMMRHLPEKQQKELQAALDAEMPEKKKKQPKKSEAEKAEKMLAKLKNPDGDKGKLLGDVTNKLFNKLTKAEQKQLQRDLDADNKKNKGK